MTFDDVIAGIEKFKGHRGGGVKSFFSQLDFILKSFIQATR